MYIVFEGIPGAGKSTQLARLIAYLQEHYPSSTFKSTREPGGSSIGSDIRQIVQVNDYDIEMSKWTEVYLYAADRAQTISGIVLRFLAEGAWVFSDRSFIASLVFQGIGYGLGLMDVWEVNSFVVFKKLPDMVIFFDINPAMAKSRTSDVAGDKHESNPIEFYQAIAEGYYKAQQFLAKVLGPKMMWVTLDANGTEEEVFQSLLTIILPLLKDK